MSIITNYKIRVKPVTSANQPMFIYGLPILQPSKIIITNARNDVNDSGTIQVALGKVIRAELTALASGDLTLNESGQPYDSIATSRQIRTNNVVFFKSVHSRVSAVSTGTSGSETVNSIQNTGIKTYEAEATSPTVLSVTLGTTTQYTLSTVAFFEFMKYANKELQQSDVVNVTGIILTRTSVTGTPTAAGLNFFSGYLNQPQTIIAVDLNNLTITTDLNTSNTALLAAINRGGGNVTAVAGVTTVVTSKAVVTAQSHAEVKVVSCAQIQEGSTVLQIDHSSSPDSLYQILLDQELDLEVNTM